MSYKPDISVFSPDEKLQAIVEVKGVAHKGRTWAEQLRRNLLAHSVVPYAPFFVLALRDHIYVWKQAADSAHKRPDVELSTTEVLEPLFPTMRDSVLHAEASSLELFMVSVLEALAKEEPTVIRTPWARQLAKTGLLDAIRHGEVRIQSAA